MTRLSTLYLVFFSMSKPIYQAENEFARDLVATLVNAEQRFFPHPQNDQKLLIKKANGDLVNLNLTPFHASLQPATSCRYFDGITDIEDLIAAYNAARRSSTFEEILNNTHVHIYAQEYLSQLFQQARESLNKDDAKRIANWVKNFDVYVAVKCIESLLNSKADLALLELAESFNWNVHFDHLAIRCGSAKQHHAEAVVELLTQHHGYIASQVKEEVFYQFADGWNAYLLYKVLENGQVLRLFIDQSNANVPTQIIQHWNYVYGFTAHHLAIRATKKVNGYRSAVSLNEIIDALKTKGVEVMTPTGMYTQGLLQQVFARPEVDKNIPAGLTRKLSKYGEDLEKAIKNAKLLELVSRTEMDAEFAKRYYAIYGLKFNANDSLHTAPIYNYFLPAQAAHVIKTSLNLFQ